MVSKEQLNRVLHACGFPTVSEYVGAIIVRQINNMTEDVNEVAMFLAQLILKSGGFQYRSEVDGPSKDYAPYYGRGYIQLTHDYNYEAASQAIFNDDRLLRDPDQVSDTEELSMRVSVWFWQAIVRPRGGPQSNNFGLTSAAINGTMEPPGNSLARVSYQLYLEAARVLGVQELAREF